ncbi:MAG TPA: class II aldolase/adducin family protein [Solirubrobacteraceae bacterium]|jgi:L-fuculose-phosphate aldolase
MLHSEREEVAAAARRLAEQGLVGGTSGNVSARFGEHVCVTPTGGVLASLVAEDVSVVSLDGRRVHGRLAPTSELDLHLGVYRRFGTGAVVHTHAPVATALSCVAGLEEVPCVHYEMLLLGGTVRVARYATFGSPELAESVLEALDGRTAALMANHGAVAHGADLASAMRAMELLEWACTVYWRARAVGEPRALTEEQRQDVIEYAVRTRYGTTREEGG